MSPSRVNYGPGAQDSEPFASRMPFQPCTMGHASRNDTGSPSISPETPRSAHFSPIADATTGMPSVYAQGRGVLRMSVLQGDDSTYRLVQNCAAAASAVIWNMEKRTQELYERFARQYVDRNEEWRGTLDGELTEAVLKQYDFLKAYIAVEGLEEPGKGVFKRFQRYWPTIKDEGFKPSEHKYHWKRVYTSSGHEDMAREALDLSPKSVRERLAKWTLVDSNACRTAWDEKPLTKIVAVAIILVAVLVFSVPTILLAMETVSSKGGRVSIIVVSNMLLGVVLMLSGMQPGYAIGITMTYSAVMVNVDV